MLFRSIILPKEGDHTPSKQDEDGAICGIYQDDKTNRLDGPVRLLAVDSNNDEDESTSAKLGLAICGLVGIGIGYAVKTLIDFIKDKKRIKENHSEPVNEENELLSELAAMLEEIGKSENEENRQQVFKIVCDAIIIANRLRRLSLSTTLPEEQRQKLYSAFDKLASPEIIASVNQVLLENKKRKENTETWPDLFANAVKDEFTPISQEALQTALQIE